MQGRILSHLLSVAGGGMRHKFPLQLTMKNVTLILTKRWKVTVEINTVWIQGCLVQVGNGIELEAVGLQFEPYRWCPCGVIWDSSRTVVVIKLRRTGLRPPYDPYGSQATKSMNHHCSHYTDYVAESVSSSAQPNPEA